MQELAASGGMCTVHFHCLLSKYFIGKTYYLIGNQWHVKVSEAESTPELIILQQKLEWNFANLRHIKCCGLTVSSVATSTHTHIIVYMYIVPYICAYINHAFKSILCIHVRVYLHIGGVVRL